MNASHFWRNASPPCCTVQQYSTATKPGTACNQCGGFMVSGRRGGIAGRGQGSSQSTTTTSSTKRARYEATPPPNYQANVIHEEQDEDCDTDCEYYSISPPLSPKSTVPPRKRASQREDSKRTHPPLKRKPSWGPSLKQEFTRRGSIDAVMTNAEDERVWRKVCGDTAGTRENGGMGTGIGMTSMSSVGTVADGVTGGVVMDTRQRRRQSTLLHPSTPADERADPLALYAAPGVQVVDARPAAVAASILPSSSSSSSPFFPPPAPAPTTAPTTTTETAPSKRPQRPTLGPRKGSSLLHPSPPTSEVEISSGTQLKTVISVPPMKREEVQRWDTSLATAVAPERKRAGTNSDGPRRGLGTTSPPLVHQFPRHQRVLAQDREQEDEDEEEEEWGRVGGGGPRYISAVQNPRLHNVLAGYMAGVEQQQQQQQQQQQHQRQREGSVMHSCLSDDDDEGDGEECTGRAEMTTRRVGNVDKGKKGDLIIMLKELRMT